MELYLVGGDPQGEPSPPQRIADRPSADIEPSLPTGEARNAAPPSEEMLVLARWPEAPGGGGEAA